MGNILLVTTVYRTGEKIYPIIPSLLKFHNIEVLNLGQMSVHTLWDKNEDIRSGFYGMCNRLSIKVMNGPGITEDKDYNDKIYVKFMKDLSSFIPKKYYDLIILDNNITQKRIGLSELYKYFSVQEIPFIGCPHGNREFKGYRILKRIGRLYDASFVLGEKEKNELIKNDNKRIKYKDRLFPSGIPSNDKLKNMKRENKYILIIPNFTTKQPEGTITEKFIPFTKDSFIRLKIPKLSEEYCVPIIIKEKVKMFYEDTSLRNNLKEYKSIVSFVSECKEDNQLIADALCVISAPSTMAFKPIQMGVPTVLLKGHGMIGNFYDYKGIVKEDADQIRDSIKKQLEEGKFVDFVDRTLSGGIEFNATELYINYINNIIKGTVLWQ